ncbi:YodC family protein [Hansschlegelia zhihuaiae]|uniref:DUF2158 domain-containing protein n=1 Tax=Hansschlegelia zhihuaiae TaxID=405005 RepID=A0A4Q0MNN3_9HYPH|nr:DUF2158 domain-containing protein [Hansschlegelia zhihuaiae]
MAVQFKPGDLVTLKSGGPGMTVDAVEYLNGLERAVCFWFSEEQAHKAVFAVTSLEALEQEPAEARRPERGRTSAPARTRRRPALQIAAE